MKCIAARTSLVLGALLLAGIGLSLWTKPTLASLPLVEAGNSFFGAAAVYNLSIADALYRTAIYIDPNVPDAWHQRARIAFLRGDFADAREKIDRQLALHGDSLMASYYIRGLIAGYDGRFADAEGDFMKFIAWDKENWAAHNDLAWIYFSQGKFVEAKDQTALALSYAPQNAWLLMMHAMALYNLGEKERAYQELLKAKEAARLLTEGDWSWAYPGNDPAVASQGLAEFRATIDGNLALVHRALGEGE